ncbi:MAG: hypothetical protein ACFFDT_20115 [Candidatus Hodarchaeota archaeon]
MTQIRYQTTVQKQDCNIKTRLQQLYEEVGLESQELQKIKTLIVNRHGGI